MSQPQKAVIEVDVNTLKAVIRVTHGDGFGGLLCVHGTKCSTWPSPEEAAKGLRAYLKGKVTK